MSLRYSLTDANSMDSVSDVMPYLCQTDTFPPPYSFSMKQVFQRSPISPLSPPESTSFSDPATPSSSWSWSSMTHLLNENGSYGPMNSQPYGFPGQCNHQVYCSQYSQFNEGFEMNREHEESRKTREMEYTLQQLEHALLGPENDDPDLGTFKHYGLARVAELEECVQSTSSPSDSSYRQEDSCNNCALDATGQDTCLHDLASMAKTRPSKEALELISDPKELLFLCAAAIDDDDKSYADIVIAKLNQVVSIYGDPMQRLAAYMVEGLSAKIQSTGPSLCRILNCKKPPKNEVLSAMQILYEVCPYFKFGHMAANGAIAEAFKDEERVHIIDFEIALGTQWISLIQALAARQGGAPHIKITGVGDPQIDAAAPGGLETVGQRLTKLAESVGVILEFYPLQMNGAEVQPHMLKVQPGEALAVNFAMQLHHMPDESVCVENPRERILRMVKSLHPKVVTLVEQEANTNTANFLSRLKETFCYYSAFFYSIDITLWKRNFRKYKTICLRLQTVLREILTNCGEEEPSQTKDGLHGPRGSSFLEELTNYLIDFVSGDSKSSLAVQDINGNLIGMFYHGFLTMSSLLNGVFSRLAQHPDVQAKVFSEVHQISEGTISSEDKLKKMKYLIATVYESARLLPTNQILQRCSRGHDISLGGLVIPAGAVVAIPVHTVQTDVEHWGQDAEKFNPGRFFRSAPGEAKLQKSGEKTVDVGMFSKSEVLDVKPPECSGVLKDDGFLDMEQSGMPENFIEDPSFLLFGGGARACVGRNFVTMTVVSLVAELLQVFEIIVGPSNVDLSKAEDIKVLFKPRNYVVD